MNRRAGEYILEEQIGQGAFDTVYRARHHMWADQIVAVKIPTDPQYLRALQREGIAVHGLVHPNIVRAIGFDPYADPPYLAMEYVPGTSLRPLIGRLTVDQSVSILRQVLMALSFAHSRGVIHRDVKPENVLIHDGVAKLTDFGLGQAAATLANGGANSIAYSMSVSGADAKVVGTMDYMAPEVKAGEPADPRNDLYACGVMLFEMLTGERPAGTEVPSDVKPNIPRGLDDLFRRSYARLEKRFTSANEFLAALDSARSGAQRPAPATGGRMGGIATEAYGQQQQRNCPRCRGHVEGDDQFCIHCGLRLAARVRRCGKCGAYPDGSDQYCIFCGETLETRTVTA
jgi:serine/threonine protein kinase